MQTRRVNISPYCQPVRQVKHTCTLCAYECSQTNIKYKFIHHSRLAVLSPTPINSWRSKSNKV